jgi:hypothetical protein
VGEFRRSRVHSRGTSLEVATGVAMKPPAGASRPNILSRRLYALTVLLGLLVMIIATFSADDLRHASILRLDAPQHNATTLPETTCEAAESSGAAGADPSGDIPILLVDSLLTRCPSRSLAIAMCTQCRMSDRQCYLSVVRRV